MKYKIILGALLFAVCLISLNIGSYPLSFFSVSSDIWHHRFSQASVILWEIRFPRMLLGLLVGGSLGLAGAAMQGFLRNPFAEPGVLGISGGASLGAVLVLYSGLSSAFSLALPLGGIVGALIFAALLYFLAGPLSIHALILSGIALNLLAFAGTSLVLNLSQNPYARLEIVFWQMGSLQDRSWNHLALAAPFILTGAWMIWKNRNALDVLTLGEETAQSMGVNLKRLQWIMIFGTALAVGAGVAVCGSIGFVGLVVPHLLRPWVKHEPGKLLGISALGGAILILGADILVRLIPAESELKLGVLTSLLGAPFFLSLIFQMRKRVN
ncbi:MAG: iron ABC transporter permease [Candidatus Omnitrophica bacterium]|nr:iron ABC transporter permease [Candidatus Omnitrophota bacterium]